MLVKNLLSMTRVNFFNLMLLNGDTDLGQQLTQICVSIQQH